MSNATVPYSSTPAIGNTTIDSPDEAAEFINQIAVNASYAAESRFDKRIQARAYKVELRFSIVRS